MKKIILSAVLASFVFASCGTDVPTEQTAPATDSCAVKCDTTQCDTLAVEPVDTLTVTPVK